MLLDQLLSRIADYTHDAIFVTEANTQDADATKIVYVNPAFTQLTGYTPEEAIGQSPRLLEGPNTDRATLDKIRRAAERNEAIDVEMINYSRKKHAYWVEASISPVFDGQGRCTHYVAIEKDITDRKVMQEATEKQSMEFLFSEARTRAILYSIVDGIITFESDGMIERFSPSAEQIFGYDAAEMEKRPLSVLFPEEEAEHYLGWFRKFCNDHSGGSAYQKRDIRGKRKGGEEFLAELSLSKINSGDKMLLVAAVRDVTELKQAEEEARNQNRMVKLLQRVASAANAAESVAECFNRASELICGHFNLMLSHSYLYDERNDLLVSTGLWYAQNEDACHAFMQNSDGLSFPPGTEMIGKAYLMNRPVLIPDLPDCTGFLRHPAAMEAGIKGAYAFPVELDGQVVAVLEFFAGHHWMPGEEELDIMANIGTQLGRVIERKKNEQAILAAKEAAEASTRAKSEFLANMSHELRTPMNGILGLAELLRESGLKGTQSECAEALHGSASALLVILNDILDFSKIEAGELTLESCPFALTQILDHVQDLLAPIARKKQLALHIDRGNDVGELFRGDESRIQQILINLVGNAIKFTEQGEIRVAIACEERQGALHRLRFSVTDTGIGIPAHSVASIFQKFTQADNSNTRKFGGTGLGLAISKQLVEMMGGEIGVQSVEGAGSTFWFTLPLPAMSISEAPPAVMPAATETVTHGGVDASQARLLIVEDHPINSMVLTQLLGKLGITQFDMAENGREATEATRAHRYDMILMDCQMPEMDGYEATAVIREQERDAGYHTPIIAMTANAMVGDREKCLKAGMNDYISKPIDFGALSQTISRWLRVCADAPTLREATAPGGDADEAAPTPIDLSHLRVFTDGDPDEEKLLFDVFMQSADESMNVLRAACSEGAQDEWRRAAHRLKGAAGNLGARGLFDVCRDAEADYAMDALEKETALLCLDIELERIRHFITRQEMTQQAA